MTAKIIDSGGHILQIVSGQERITVIRNDGLEGTIESHPKDGFSFTYPPAPRGQGCGGTIYGSSLNFYRELLLEEGKKAVAITASEAEALKKQAVKR